MTRRLYIAGPMRGYAEHNIPVFRSAAARLRGLGHDVVSPVEVAEANGHTDQHSRPAEDWVRDDLAELLTCNAIALLPGWEASTGARCEAAVAVTLGFAFYDVNGFTMEAPDRIAIAGGYDRPPGRVDDIGGDAIGASALLAITEVRRAMRKFPTWPTDPFHAAAVVGEEYGELQKALLEHTYEPKKNVSRGDIRAEAVELAAMALRFLVSFDRYQMAPCAQHEQNVDVPKAVAA